MNVKPLAHPEDVRSLSYSQRRAVVLALRKLANEPKAGKPLAPAQEWQRFEAVLTGLRALTIPGPFECELRIVYRIDGRTVEVVAIAPRMASECYRLAASRLRPDRPRVRRRMSR